LDLFAEDGAIRFKRGHGGLVVVCIRREYPATSAARIASNFRVPSESAIPSVTVRRELLI
jgi:hypothetical protein